MNTDSEFHGCKLALFNSEGEILVFLRDDKPDIESPNMWDLPGGGREGDESPEDCVLRELYEEFGLTLGLDRLIYKKYYYQECRGRSAYFFVGEVTQEETQAIQFGDEGQGWSFMDLSEYLAHPRVVPRHQRRMRDYVEHMT